MFRPVQLVDPNNTSVGGGAIRRFQELYSSRADLARRHVFQSVAFVEDEIDQVTRRSFLGVAAIRGDSIQLLDDSIVVVNGTSAGHRIQQRITVTAVHPQFEFLVGLLSGRNAT